MKGNKRTNDNQKQIVSQHDDSE
uniref:Uncharacterized protein n=1 Tax=Tetranychus urticae TaxID=32264 RepID=T1KTF3_TETUR